MNFYADYVRNKLNAAISSMSSQIEGACETFSVK